MAHEELQFQVDQLAFQLDDENKKHLEAVAALRDELKALKGKLHGALERCSAKAAEGADTPGDDTYIRRIEWRLDDFSGRVRDTPQNEAIWSVEFSVLSVPGMQLEFFPQGRDTTKLAGFCALFFWCPPGVTVKYRLRVGNHWSAPDEDAYASRMGHGHSNFCFLEAQKDEKTNSVLVGIDILSLSYSDDTMPGLRIINRAPEAVVEREVAVLQHRHMDCVEWRIKKILKRAKEVPRGTAICSPVFSIAGVREMLLEFYPQGIAPPPGGKEGREGYCGFYVRANSAPWANSGRSSSTPLTLLLTLFVGGARKGPIKTEFGSNAAKGLPEFCRLSDQLSDGEEDLIVGVQVQNPELEKEETELFLQ